MAIAKIHRWTRRLLLLAALIAAGWASYVWLKGRPQDLPWTPLRLDQPIGVFSGRKLAGLGTNRAKCMALLRDTGLLFKALPPQGSGQCPVTNAVSVTPGQAMLRFSPTTVGPSCPMVAGLAMWQWQVVEPAAQRIFNASVKQIDHFGSYSCRRIYGREGGQWSEHATANALDVSGFTLTDGTRISVAGHGQEDGKKARFLRDVRDGACDLFSTVLSPDYNAQHHDHLHLDQAQRGTTGWRVCG